MTRAPTKPQIIDAMAGIPDFWDRDVLFFANLMSLFFGNELELEELEDLVGEIDSYGGRLVPVINTIFKGKNNVLVLERSPDSALCQYFSSNLGLSLPRIEVLSHQDYLAKAKSAFSWADGRISHKTYWLDGYVTDDALSTWAANLSKPTVSSARGSHRGNNKRLLHQFLLASDLPIPPTRLANDADHVRMLLAELKRLGFRRAAVRSALGASGIGTIKAELDDERSYPQTPDFFFREGPCLVQGWIEPGIDQTVEVKSPSVQLFLDDSCVHLYDITDQILSEDSVHEGNVSPPPYMDEKLKMELLRQAGLVGSWLYSQGYRGTGSVDFIVAFQSRGKAPVVYTSEINARITGATYPSVLAKRFMPTGAWLMENLRLQTPWSGEDLMRHLADESKLYSPGNDEGIVPINFNFDQSDKVAKLQMLFLASNVDRCLDLVGELESDTRLRFEAERD